MAQYYQYPADHMGNSTDTFEGTVYGAAPAVASARKGYFFQRGARARLNIVPVLISLFVPWFLFCLLLALIALPTHFEKPILVESVVTWSTIFIIGLGINVFFNLRRKAVHPEVYQPNWLCTFCGLLWLALTLSTGMGEIIYLYGSYPYLTTKSLGTYNEVDPASTSGVQVLDAGVINFVEQSALNLDLAMGFWNIGDEFCVAPIVRPGVDSPSYDFWAVGTNCCDKGVNANFHCKHFSSNVAHSGYRLMTDDLRPFYRLAVQQSEAAFGIRAEQPLFFTWSDNATLDIEDYKTWADEAVFISILGHFVLNAFLVVCVTIIFARMGRQ